MKFSPISFSQIMTLGRCSPYVDPCAIHSLLSFFVTRGLYLPQHLQSIFFPNPISAFPIFIDVTSSLPLVVECVMSILRLISWAFRII